MTQRKVVPNGINGVTGQYDVAPVDVEALARAIHERSFMVLDDKPVARGGPPLACEPNDLKLAGWAIVFHKDESPEVREALRPLVEHRRAQIADDSRVKELVYFPGEDASAWLARHEASWSNVEPTRIPYYLLWVGSPERMPYEVTHEIDSDYFIGLLDLATPADFAAYARSVIAYETEAAVRTAREAVFFGTRHPFDEATQLSADWLVAPLAEGTPANGLTPAEPSVATKLGFRHRTLLGPAATRDALLQVLGGSTPTPALLFTASHGMVWPNGHVLQADAQGALLCQDWPGFGSVAPAHFLAGADVPDDAKVHGMVAFHFACFGGGTPANDLYVFDRGRAPPPIAPAAFTAALPRRLLAHPEGGALACIAHVERAWGTSITGITSSPQIRPFQRAVAQILVGKPVGLAVQEFNDMSATLSVVLSRLLGKDFQGNPADALNLASTWMQRNDAAGFVLLGDPAVRLRVPDLV